MELPIESIPKSLVKGVVRAAFPAYVPLRLIIAFPSSNGRSHSFVRSPNIATLDSAGWYGFD